MTSHEKPFPDVPKALLEALERQFPDRAPDIDLPDRKVWAAVGKTELIRFLRVKFDEQNQGITRKT